MSRRRLDPMIWINPSEVRYTKATISDCFEDGQRLTSVYDKIVQQKFKVEDIAPIRVTRKDGEWWSLDNRRLYLLKQLESEKLLDLVQMKQVEVTSAEAKSFETKFEGRHVNFFTHKLKDRSTERISEHQSLSETKSSNWLYNCFIGIIFIICFFLTRKVFVEFSKALEKQSRRN